MKTLAECIQEWMVRYKQNSVKPSTYDRLETSYNALLNYSIANIGIEVLRVEDLQNYINQLVEDGYALTTIKKQYHLIGSFLNYANTEGIVQRPIHHGVKLPAQSAVKKKKKEVVVYSKPEQAALLKVLRTNERVGYGAAILMLESGMRVGEALALTWDDVLWDRRAIRVDKTVIRLNNRHRMQVQDGAKSYTSNRTIPLSTEALRLLNSLFDQTDDPHGYIFAGEDRRPISYEALRYQIQYACAEAKVPYKGQHVFRHTFATNCYYRGCDVKILSKLLGHADVAITYNVYINLFGDALEEMRSVVG